MWQKDDLSLRNKVRYESHALLEVRTSRWNPFAVESAVLIDLSWEGFKLEFVAPLKDIAPNSSLSLSIPLAPFGVMHPSVLKLKAETRWFDSRTFRCGGVLCYKNDEEKMIVGKIIEFVSQKKMAESLSHEPREAR